ncbi:MAG: hypothetical protein ACYC4L_20630, partial [Chloroflexota bacterium]
MWRKMFLLVAVVALLLASVSSAYAYPKPKADKLNPGKGQLMAAEKAQKLDDVDPAEKADKPAAGELRGKAFQGTIKGNVGDDVDDLKWTVITAKYGEIVVDVAKADFKWPGRKGVTGAAFKAGDRVVVQLSGKFDGAADMQAARRVQLVPAGMFVHVTGQLLEASGTTIKVKPGDKAEMTFNLEEVTTIKDGPDVETFKDFTIAELAKWKDKQVTVVARQADGQMTATAVVLHGNLDSGNTGNSADADDDDEDDD